MRDIIATSDARKFVKGFKELLTAEQEMDLFRSWWDSNPAAFNAFMDPTDEDTNRFVGGADDIYLKRIIEEYSPVIRRCIKELSGYRMDEDELLSEGLMALAEAARRFNPTGDNEGVRFAPYAKTCVKGMMQGFIMRNFFMVNVCTNHTKKSLFYALRKLIAIELKEHGTFRLSVQQAQELGEKFKVPEEEVMQMYDLFHRSYESLDQPIPRSMLDDNEASLGDCIPDKEETADEAIAGESVVTFQRRVINEAMEQVLSPRERRIFVAQVLAEEKEDQMTLDELGDVFGVSKERVRQLRISASKKMHAEILRRAKSENIDPDDFFLG